MLQGVGHPLIFIFTGRKEIQRWARARQVDFRTGCRLDLQAYIVQLRKLLKCHMLENVILHIWYEFVTTQDLFKPAGPLPVTVMPGR